MIKPTGPEFDHIQVKQLGETFVAEVAGVDFSKPVTSDVFAEIHRAITEYGVLVFRHARLDDAGHVAFSRLFGELDDTTPYLAMGRQQRLPFVELFDVSNLEDDGSVVKIGSKRDAMGRGNNLFHVDSSFNPRRAGFSLLRAHTLPPTTLGGNTDFADTRTAYAELPAALAAHLSEQNYVAAHSLMHSRRKAASADSACAKWLEGVDPEAYGFGRHRLVQVHEASGRRNLYVANHVHHLELPLESDGESGCVGVGEEGLSGEKRERRRVPKAEGTALIERLLEHCTRPRYVVSVAWENEGDLVAWDNTCVMHRAGEGRFTEMGVVRDMRRCTVHDGGRDAWGFNEKGGGRMGLP